MRQIIVLHTAAIAGGNPGFDHSDVQIRFRHWTGAGALPLLDGSICAFIDRDLPGMSGLDICRRLRCDPLAAQAHITIVLPAEDQAYRRSALQAGADDCLIGPVDRSTILDRILSRNLDDYFTDLARTESVGDLSLDIAACQARWKDEPVRLTLHEFRLLRYLVEHPGQVFTRSQLVAALGREDSPPDERTVDVWIARLRRALRAAGSSGMLRTVRSQGYVLDKA